MITTARLQRDTAIRLAPLVAVVVGAMLLLPITDVRGIAASRPLTFGQLGPIAGVFDLITGQALLVSGVLAWILGPRARIGTLCMLAGICWFGPDLFALVRADPLIRSLGRFVLTPFLWPLLLHLAAASLGMDRRRSVTVALALLYLGAAGVAIVSLATYDAFFDPYCIDCSWHNPFLVARRVGAVRASLTLGAAVAGVVAVAAVAATVRWATVGARTRGRAAVAVGALLLVLASTARVGLVIVAPRGDPADVRWLATWIALGLACLGLSTGVAILGFESWRTAARMRRVAESLEAAPAPGTLEQVLRRALGDPMLRVAYVIDDGVLVDQNGRPLAFEEGRSSAWMPVERDGVLVARIRRAASVDAGALDTAFGPTVLVALDNERLRAARLAQLEQLRASRARIVSLTDAERTRLERDLHDGIQQQLLTVVFDLRLARLAAERAGWTDRASLFEDGQRRANDAVEELRQIAHGVHPAVLSRSGLVPALTSLADRSAIPLEVDADGVGRLPIATETAAYSVVEDALNEAQDRGASYVSVSLAAASSDHLRIEIADDSPDSASPLMSIGVSERVADRVGAAGGDAHVERTPDRRRLLTVELPCA